MIELANEVRKVLGVGNVVAKEKKLVGAKEKKLVGAAQLPHPSHVPIPTLQLHPLPEPIAMDS